MTSEGGTAEQISSTKSAVIGGAIAAVVIVLTAVVVIYVVWARRRDGFRYYINVYVLNHRRKPTADYASFLTPSPWVDSYKFPRFHA